MQQHPNWSGYACLQMLLSAWGYQVNQEQLFEAANPDWPAGHDRYGLEARPSFDQLFRTARLLVTDPAHRIQLLHRLHFCHPNWQNYRPAQSDAAEQDSPANRSGLSTAQAANLTLRHYLARDRPVLIQMPRNHVVVVGFDDSPGAPTYFYNEPVTGGQYSLPPEQLSRMWGGRSLTFGTSYFMLAVRSVQVHN